VYVDYDPIVLAHARALLISGQAGATDYIDADLRDTGTILSQAAKLLDFTQPVAVTTARTWWSPGWCGSRNGARSAAPARRASPPGGARWAASADLRPVASRQCLRGRRNGRDFRPAACAQDPKTLVCQDQSGGVIRSALREVSGEQEVATGVGRR